MISDMPYRPNWPIKAHLFINSGRLDNVYKCLFHFIFHIHIADVCDAAKSLATNIQGCVTKPSVSVGLGLIYRFDPLRVEVNFGVPLVASKSDSYRRGFQVGVGVDFL
jgi:outer membrane protein insertion porin family